MRDLLKLDDYHAEREGVNQQETDHEEGVVTME